MKKLLALLLVIVMVAAVFAGCAKDNQDPSNSQAPAGSGNEQPSNEPVNSDEIVDLKWITVGNGMPENYDAWKANLDKYLEEKIGVHLSFEVIPWGDWDTRRNVIVSTNEPYDIIFGNNGTYTGDINLGALADMSGLLNTVPGLTDLIPEDYWKSLEVGGKIYGVPTYKDSSATQYFIYDENLVKETGLDYENAHTMEAVTPILKAMYEKKGEAVFILNKGGLDAIYGKNYDDLSLGFPAIGVSYKNGEAKAVSVFEQDDIKADLATLRSWYQVGYVNSDAAVLDEAPKYRPCFVAQGWSAAAKTTWGPNMKADAVAIQWGDTVMSNSTVQGSINSVSASCKYPEKALKLLELVNTDSYVRDALYYGLEGDNFTYTADGKVVVDDTKSWGMAGYTQGTFFDVSYKEGDNSNQWAELQALNAQAVASPALGFAFDQSNVTDEIKACKAIFDEYRPILMTGAADPTETINTMLSAMRDSGFDKILTEVQTQLDAWVASK